MTPKTGRKIFPPGNPTRSGPPLHYCAAWCLAAWYISWRDFEARDDNSDGAIAPAAAVVNTTRCLKDGWLLPRLMPRQSAFAALTSQFSFSLGASSTMATELLQSYYVWADVMEQKLFAWVDPNGAYKLNPMADYPLANFASVYAICVGYLVFVIFGTALMKAGIPALNTSALQFMYNPFQVIVCSYMCLEAAIQAYRNNYTAAPCNAFNASNPVMGNVLYLFFLSKILDLCDTFFIVAGKKWKQLSVLHVYHHLTVLVFYYVCFRCAQDGDSYATIVLNGFVHTIMYTYYFVSAHTRNIWWKKYLTTMQLTQFVIMNVQGYLTYSRQCPGFPTKIPVLYLFYVQSLFWLFMNFYIRAYVLGGSKKAVAAKKNV